jgi:hypothetical protein
MPPKQTQQTSDDKLDLILQKITAIEVRQEKLEQLVTKVTQLENLVAEQKCVIATMQTEIKNLKEMANVQDQATRGDTLRLFNVPGSNDEVGLPNKVYENILKPILAAAKNSGEIQTLPHLNTICTSIFRAGKFAAGSNKPPPPVIIKFASLPARMAILKNKRVNTPPPPEGQKKYIIVEDLTKPTYKKLQEFRLDERTNKAWTINGEIWVLPVGDNMKPKRVSSVFDSVDDFFG